MCKFNFYSSFSLIGRRQHIYDIRMSGDKRTKQGNNNHKTIQKNFCFMNLVGIPLSSLTQERFKTLIVYEVGQRVSSMKAEDR